MAQIIKSRLRELRDAKGFSQQDLASRAGLATRTIASIEAGTKLPRLETALAIADVLGVSLDDLVFGPQPFPDEVPA